MKGKLIIHDEVIDIEFDSMPKFKLDGEELIDENGQKYYTPRSNGSNWLPFEFKVSDDSKFKTYFSSRNSVYLISGSDLLKFHGAHHQAKYEQDKPVNFELIFDKCHLC